MKPTIILLNGPPRSGKDTLGAMLRERIERPSLLLKFAGPLKAATAAFYAAIEDGYRGGGSHATELYTDAFWRLFEGDEKDLPTAKFLDATPRRALIAVSETLMKPLHGDDVFGRLLADDIANSLARGHYGTFIVTDSGFVGEAKVLVQRFGREALTVVRLYRSGCTFDGDSRNWLPRGFPCASLFDIDNNRALTDLELHADWIIREMIARKEVA